MGHSLLISKALKVATFTMNSKVVLIAAVAIAHFFLESEAVPGADTNGACNCSRQTSGGCAPTNNLCISGKCTCSSVVGVCVGSCGGKPLWSFWGRKEIEDQEDEERGADTNGACNCSRQTSGGCAVTKNLCISGKCTCSSVVGVCVGSCGGKPLWSFWGR